MRRKWRRRTEERGEEQVTCNGRRFGDSRHINMLGMGHHHKLQDEICYITGKRGFNNDKIRTAILSIEQV